MTNFGLMLEKNFFWLICAYHRETGEIVGYICGKRNSKTTKELRTKLNDLKVSFNTINTDDWDSFKIAFYAEIKDKKK